jgi:hypothetical protein
MTLESSPVEQGRCAGASPLRPRARSDDAGGVVAAWWGALALALMMPGVVAAWWESTARPEVARGLPSPRTWRCDLRGGRAALGAAAVYALRRWSMRCRRVLVAAAAYARCGGGVCSTRSLVLEALGARARWADEGESSACRGARACGERGEKHMRAPPPVGHSGLSSGHARSVRVVGQTVT